MNKNTEIQQKSWFFIYPNTLFSVFSFGVIGFGTIKLLKGFQLSKYKNLLNRKLITVKSANNQHDLSKFQLIYYNGDLKSSNKQPFIDQLFGISSIRNDCLGLYRKVEIFSFIQNQNVHCWGNINYINYSPIDKNLVGLKSKVILNDDVYLQDYPLSNDMMIELAEQCSTVFKIDQKCINDNFEQLQNELEMKPQNQDPQKIKIIESLYQIHPFKYQLEYNKHLIFSDNYIYICTDKDKFTEGDIRISFHEAEQISKATVIAAYKNGVIDIHTIPDIDFNIVITNQKGELITTRLGLINFIQKGIISQQDFIQQLVERLGKQTKYEQCIYTLLIFATYYYLLNPYGFLSFFTTASHQLCIHVFISGRIISSVALGSLLLLNALNLLFSSYENDCNLYDKKYKLK